MKLLRTLALMLLCLNPGFSGAQSYDFTTSYGFNVTPNRLVPLTDNRWLAVCTGSPNPGAVYLDTVVAIVFNADGEVLFEKRLELPPSEVYNVYSATGTPNGGFAINVSRDLCDATNQFSLLVFDVNGDLKWSNHFNPERGLLGISATGNLMVLARRAEKLLEYDLETGELLSATPMKDPLFAYGITRDFEFLAGGNAYISVGSHILERWERQNDGSFLLVKTNPIASIVIPELVKGSPTPGQYYTFQKGSSQLFRFNAADLEATLLADFPFSLIDVVATPDNLLALVDDGVGTSLLKLNFQGGIIDTVRTYSSAFKADGMGYQNNDLVLLGQHRSGPAAPYNAWQMWIHTNHTDAAPPTITMDAELTYVDQTVLLGVDSFYVSFLNAYAYNFTGGIYEIIISNRSSTLLKSVDINISFEENPLNICPYRPAKTIHYEGLNLQPNASALLIFDQINATFQPKIPDQFCFWISNPNHTPDAVPGNDIYCETFNHVATLEPQADMFTLAPNPANTAVRVTFQEPAKTGSWKVLDLLGRQMTSGAVEQGSMALEIPTSELPAGMYSLWVNGRSVKVAVAH